MLKNRWMVLQGTRKLKVINHNNTTTLTVMPHDMIYIVLESDCYAIHKAKRIVPSACCFEHACVVNICY